MLSAAHAQSFPLFAHSEADSLNVRAGQNTNFEIIAKLNKGEEVVVEEEEYGWYRIRLPQHAQAFVSADFVNMINAEVGQVTGSRVNVRSGPSIRHSVLGQVKAEDRVRVLSNNKGWMRIEPWPDMSGWVHGDYIKLSSKEAPPISLPVYNGKVEKMGHVTDPISDNQPIQQVAQGESLEEMGRIKTTDVNACEDKLSHQLMRDGNIIAYLKGPSNIFDSFGVAAVRVKGTVSRQPDDNCKYPVLNVTSVNLVL